MKISKAQKHFKDNFQKYRDQDLTLHEIATKYQTSESSIMRWIKKLGLKYQSLRDINIESKTFPGETTNSCKSESLPKNRILKLLQHGSLLVGDYAAKNNVDELIIYKTMDAIEKDGYAIIKDSHGYGLNKNISTVEKYIELPKDKLTFGVVGDTHMGSKYQQLTFLNRSYDDFKKRGITTVLHTGDITDGSPNMHKGCINELFVHGATTQRDYVVDKYPKRPGIVTKFITGNHDSSWMKDNGFSMGESIASKRSDMEWLGDIAAYAMLGKKKNIKAYLFHPRKVPAYATSYPVQKVVECFTSENKPHLMFMGHFHQAEYLFKRNVHCIQSACFQAQTTYLKEKGLMPEVGYWIITIEISERGIEGLTYNFNPLYIAKQDDY